MATCSISGSFDIVLEANQQGTPDFNVAKVFTVTRGFSLVGITAYNTNAAAGTLTVTRTTTTNGVAAAGVVMTAIAAGTVGAGAYFTNAAAPGNVQCIAVCSSNAAAGAANCIVPSPQSGNNTAGMPTVSTTITVLDSGSNLSKIVLHCVSENPQAITLA